MVILMCKYNPDEMDNACNTFKLAHFCCRECNKYDRCHLTYRCILNPCNLLYENVIPEVSHD